MLIDSGFYRRLKFYLFGFAIGALAVNFIFKGKACRMPATIKLEELQKQTKNYTTEALCEMNCNGIDTTHVNEILLKGKIEYSKSEVHDTPCPKYVVEGETKNSIPIAIIIADCDTISKVINVRTKKNCDCLKVP